MAIATSFYEQPILNSPYEPPSRHHALDDNGQPLNQEPVDGRRRSELITPVPQVRKKPRKDSQTSFVMPDAHGLSTEDQEYNPTPIINEIRGYVAAWRALVADSDWEAELAQVAEARPCVLAYVKNHGMQFEVPYRSTENRRYWPDYIVRIDDGQPDPLNLIIEIKGFRNSDAQLKWETMRNFWVRGVNNLGTYGRWAFAEFRNVYKIEAAFDTLVADALVAAPVAA